MGINFGRPTPSTHNLNHWLISTQVATEWWLAKWADARRHPVDVFGLATFPAQNEGGLAARWRWARVYLSLGAASVVFCFLRTQWGFQGGVRAARKLYEGVSARTLNAPMSYFDTTPQGRVVSRFTFDTEQIDVLLTVWKSTSVSGDR